VKNQNYSVLIAKKILMYAQNLIDLLRTTGSGLTIKTEHRLRLDVPVFTVEILQQKLLLHKGFLHL